MACHLPPAGVGTPSAFNFSAALRADNPDSPSNTLRSPSARSRASRSNSMPLVRSPPMRTALCGRACAARLRAGRTFQISTSPATAHGPRQETLATLRRAPWGDQRAAAPARVPDRRGGQTSTHQLSTKQQVMSDPAAPAARGGARHHTRLATASAPGL